MGDKKVEVNNTELLIKVAAHMAVTGIKEINYDELRGIIETMEKRGKK